MLRVTLLHKIPVNRLSEVTGLKSIMNIVKNKKINLFKKIKHGNSVSKTCLEGKVKRKKSRGRPRRRWTQDILEWTESETMYEATKQAIRQ